MDSNQDSRQDSAESAAVERRDAPVLIGKTIAGRYEIIKRIGQGGMGVVYLAQQSALSREVVLKALAPDLVDDQAAVARFEREARGLSRLQHPNVVTIFDFGRDGEHAYIVMEYVQGETLSRFLRRNGPLQTRAFAPIAIQILKGLGEAHKLGLIHRDIKPTNIMLCEMEGRADYVKILDFGLAKLVKSPSEVTKEQHLVGSAAFLSPEQILHSQASPRSDVYALGVLFYLMLSGKRPFRAENDAVLLYKHVNEEPPPLATRLPPEHDLPEPLVDLVQSCLAKDPEQRPADANALLEAMTAILAGQPGAIPWVTGDFAAIPPTEPSAGPRTGRFSAELADEHTPPARGVSADTLNPADFSRSLGSQSVVVVSPDHGRRNLYMGIVLGALVLGFVVLFALQLVSSSPQPTTPAADENGSIDSVLNEVGQLIESERWGKAEIVLDSVADKLAGNPELLVRAADFRDRIAIGRLLSQASRQRQGGDVAGAIASYQQVLQRDPANEAAKAGLDGLVHDRDAAEQRAYGVISVTSRPQAVVHIDGRESGPTPISVELPPGRYAVRVTAEGVAPWEQGVEVVKGETRTFDLDLVASAVTPPVEPDRTGAQTRRRARRRAGDGPDAGPGAETTQPAQVQTDEPADAGLATVGEDKGKDNGLLLPVGSRRRRARGTGSEELLLPVGGSR